MNDLIRYGVCVLEKAPSEEGFLNKLAARIGPVRDSNFGALWDVVADVSLAGDAKTNTTANTGLRLGPHTDLPTREIPPGYQFLHCLINEADGGESTLTDGAALVQELKIHHPADYELLSTRRWVFLIAARELTIDGQHRLLIRRVFTPCQLCVLFIRFARFPICPRVTWPRPTRRCGAFTSSPMIHGLNSPFG